MLHVSSYLGFTLAVAVGFVAAVVLHELHLFLSARKNQGRVAFRFWAAFKLLRVPSSVKNRNYERSHKVTSGGLLVAAILAMGLVVPLFGNPWPALGVSTALAALFFVVNGALVAVQESLGGRGLGPVRRRASLDRFVQYDVPLLLAVAAALLTWLSFASDPAEATGWVSVDAIVRFQRTHWLRVGSLQFPAFFALLNPFAALAVFSVLAGRNRQENLDPKDHQGGYHSQLHDLYGGRLLLVNQTRDSVAFFVGIALFLDLFLGGGFSSPSSGDLAPVLYLGVAAVLGALAALPGKEKPRPLLDRRVTTNHRTSFFLSLAALAQAAVVWLADLPGVMLVG
ncbi:MAG: hypothetical protein Kow0069_29930 [Promethearchaeota archaeon]